ncbi:hypothetical protein F0562_024632 [Nyssa sinensis]|uniref:Uncharacterized protein n=1 Tax=Nyssa sinensis TaxID=561372 RepID=A0A5J5BCM4_9ASTE|nr:hypothetical protein F0562_024632 [Nyssa sinensis]
MDDTLLEETDDKTVLYLPGNKPRRPLPKKMDDTSLREKNNKTFLYLPGTKQGTPLHKELRLFLEEEQKASEAGLSLNEERMQEEIEEMEKERVDNASKRKPEECSNKAIVATEDEDAIVDKLRTLKVEEGGKIYKIPCPVLHEPEKEEDEESRKQRGKGNVEKWLQMLLENTQEEGGGSWGEQSADCPEERR